MTGEQNRSPAESYLRFLSVVHARRGVQEESVLSEDYVKDAIAGGLRVWAEYVSEDGCPTGEAWLVVRDGDEEQGRIMLSADDAERLGDLLVQIASSRHRASDDNVLNEQGAGI